MDSSNVSSASVNTSADSNSTCVTAKMRRLKIQEDLLVQSIKKSMPTGYGENENNFIKSDLDYKKYVSGLKKSYADIKQLFEDIKCTTKSQEILSTLDIDDIKKDVLGLDNKIKTFKSFLEDELTDLKKSEIDLIKQLEHDATLNIIRNKKCVKVTTKSYSDIVPSPVKNLIKSPLKSPEVQQFQDFISSTSKYGGWNEYNHNIFVKIWSKHFQSVNNVDSEEMDAIDREAFIDEVIEKISGIRRNHILSHMKWYSKYLFLKKRQQIALDEWRAKTKPKKLLDPGNQLNNCKNSTDFMKSERKKSRRRTGWSGDTNVKREYFSESSTVCSPTMDEDNFYSCIDANEFFKEMDHVCNLHKDIHTESEHGEKISSEYGFAKPTKQWHSRCNGKSDSKMFYTNIDHINKLGTPSWRLGLMKED